MCSRSARRCVTTSTSSPRGTNANFIQVLGPVGARHPARTSAGVEGETLACGTGVCAAAIIHHALDRRGPRRSPSAYAAGDTLSVGFAKTDEGYDNVTLTGPADFVFDGQVAI